MRQCTNCGTEAENAQAVACSKCGAKLVPAAHVLVELNDSHFYMEQFAGALELRITNLAPARITNGLLKVTGKHLDGPGQCEFSLQPGETKVLCLNVDFTKPGEPPVKFEMQYECDCDFYAFSHSTFFKVFAKAEPIRKIEAHFTQNINVAEGGKFGFGLDNRTDILRGIRDEKIKDANDLIAQQLPPHWAELALPLDEPLTESLRRQHDRVRVVRELAGVGEPVSRMCVTFDQQPAPARLLLLGLPRVRMGRLRSSNDVVLRVLPRGKANDEMTFWISKNAHLTIRMESRGVMLHDKSTNGTWLNGKLISKPTALPFDGPSVVNVGKALTLRFTPYLHFDDPAGRRVERYCSIGEPDDLWQAAKSAGVRSVVIERLSNMPGSEIYVLVFRWILIGQNPQAEIVLPEADFDARIIRLAGRFWLETIKPGRGIEANGIPVPSGWAGPLAPETKLTLGGVPAQCLPFAQCGL